MTILVREHDRTSKDNQSKPAVCLDVFVVLVVLRLRIARHTAHVIVGAGYVEPESQLLVLAVSDEQAVSVPRRIFRRHRPERWNRLFFCANDASLWDGQTDGGQ